MVPIFRAIHALFVPTKIEDEERDKTVVANIQTPTSISQPNLSLLSALQVTRRRSKFHVTRPVTKFFISPGKQLFAPGFYPRGVWSSTMYTIRRRVKLAFERCPFHSDMWRIELLTVEIQKVFHYPGNDSMTRPVEIHSS
jgi:hypothetical protein